MTTRIEVYLSLNKFAKHIKTCFNELKISSEADLRWRIAAYLEKQIKSDDTVKDWIVSTEISLLVENNQFRPDITIHHNAEVKAAFEIKVFPAKPSASKIESDINKLVAYSKMKKAKHRPNQGFLIYAYNDSVDKYEPDSNMLDLLEESRIKLVPIPIPPDSIEHYYRWWRFQR